MTRDDPNWPRASAWLAGRGTDVAVVGVPMRLGSISGGRFDLAPGHIRTALERFSVWDGERDIRSVSALDVGDVDVSEQQPDDAFGTIREAVAEAEASTSTGVVVVLGGDNSITRAGCHGVAAELERVAVLTLDAHHDLRDTADGLNNGNPIRALLEDGVPGHHVVQIGIQPFANSRAYAGVAEEAGVRVVTVTDVRRRGIAEVVSEALDALGRRVDTIYVDLDMDVLDRAFAPACPGSRPGGLAPWELQTAARLVGAHPKVRAVDIVEIDPERDVADITVMAAASCLLAFAAGLATRATA